MRQRILWVLMAAEAVLCICLYSFGTVFTSVFSSVMAFPFEQTGLFLRWLSLSGKAGNAAAIFLYAGISLAPAGILLVRRRNRRWYLEDILIGILCILLFVVLYVMINPSVLSSGLAAGTDTAFGKAFMGGMVWSVVSAFVVLKLLRLFFGADRQKLQNYLSWLLTVVNLIFVYMAAGVSYGTFLESVARFRSGNTASGSGLEISIVFLFIRYLVNALPYVMDIMIVFSVQSLMRAMKKDRYSEETAVLAKRLSKLCGMALIVMTLSGLLFNFLQLIFLNALKEIHGQIQLPLFSMVFVLGALLLAALIRENRQLKNENDMFI